MSKDKGFSAYYLAKEILRSSICDVYELKIEYILESKVQKYVLL